MKNIVVIGSLAAVLLVASNTVAWAAAPASQPAAAVADGPPLAPQLDGTGPHRFPVTTNSDRAQRFIDQGLNLAYAFNHSEAARAFREAARLDPTCAMASWGQALVLGPHVNAPMEAKNYPTAWAAIQRAKELAAAGHASDREAAYIAALETRYAPEPVEDRATLDLAYMHAMRDVVARYPGDADAATLYAEAMMDTTPWNYWLPEGKPRPHVAELLPTLESVMRRDPTNIGAHHLYIHAVEAGPNPEKGLRSAVLLDGGLAPSLGHLVHMPAHIYLRLGMPYEASECNVRAIAADQSYFSQCAAQGFYQAAYYPHNIHFLWYSRSMEGRSADSLAAAREASKYVKGHCAVEATSQRPLPLLALARFGRWNEILAEPRPGDGTNPYDAVMFHYARGLAYGATGDVDALAREKADLDRVATSEEAKSLDTPSLPATSVLKIARHELAAELARRQGRTEEWIAELTKAVATQDELPYMEPPYWYYPVRHALGAALLEADRGVEAEAVYREDLRRNPNNGYALFGLSQALAAQDKQVESRRVKERFEQAWSRADVKLTTSRF
jgi:tetratricopeptide (TPR) repeat protein